MKKPCRFAVKLKKIALIPGKGILKFARDIFFQEFQVCIKVFLFF
jgi:hypothetical protein